LNRLGRAGPGGPGFGRGPARRTGSPRARSELAAGMPPAARGCHEPGGPARAGPTGRPQDTSHQGRAARSLLKSQGRLKGREGRPPHKLLLETSHRRGRRRSACSKARPEARWHERTHARTLARWSLARARSGGGCHAPIGADSAATTSTRSSPPLERYSHPPCDLHHWANHRAKYLRAATRTSLAQNIGKKSSKPARSHTKGHSVGRGRAGPGLLIHNRRKLQLKRVTRPPD
jgi:hypothetical protein